MTFCSNAFEGTTLKNQLFPNSVKEKISRITDKKNVMAQIKIVTKKKIVFFFFLNKIFCLYLELLDTETSNTDKLRNLWSRGGS